MSAQRPDAGGAPFSLSIRRTSSRSLRNSLAFAPTMLRAMMDDEAWPSAHALTSCAKSVTVSPSILRSMVTVEPHSLECVVAVASGSGRRPILGMFPASSRLLLLYISLSMNATSGHEGGWCRPREPPYRRGLAEDENVIPRPTIFMSY